MQKKSLVLAALLLLAGVAHAEDVAHVKNETVEVSIGSEDYKSMATIFVGEATSLQLNFNEHSTTCNFTRDLGDGTPIKTTMGIDYSAGMTTLVLPFETTPTGVRSFVSVSNNLADIKEWVVFNKDCKLPVGATRSAGTSVIDNFVWGERKNIKLSDGSVVAVTFHKPSKQAGFDFKKLGEALDKQKADQEPGKKEHLAG
jgi:hypothetical protein